MDDKRVLPPPEVRGDTVTYVGLGIGALGLVLTVVGLGDKVRLPHCHTVTLCHAVAMSVTLSVTLNTMSRCHTICHTVTLSVTL